MISTKKNIAFSVFFCLLFTSLPPSHTVTNLRLCNNSSNNSPPAPYTPTYCNTRPPPLILNNINSPPRTPSSPRPPSSPRRGSGSNNALQTQPLTPSSTPGSSRRSVAADHNHQSPQASPPKSPARRRVFDFRLPTLSSPKFGASKSDKVSPAKSSSPVPQSVQHGHQPHPKQQPHAVPIIAVTNPSDGLFTRVFCY